MYTANLSRTFVQTVLMMAQDSVPTVSMVAGGCRTVVPSAPKRNLALKIQRNFVPKLATCNTTRARPHPHTPSITTDDPPLCHHPGDKQLIFRTDAQLVRLRNATRRRLRKTIYTSTWSIELADYLQDRRRYAVACTVWATRNLETI